MNPEPTQRFMIEPLLKCNITCKFCYHLHKKNEWDEYTKSFDDIRREIDAGIARGNKYVDITGGEPTIHPDICGIVEYAINRGLKVCIITNGLAGEKVTTKLINVGITDFLISIHGLFTTHNMVVQNPKAREMQVRFLKQIMGKVNIRFNCVMTRWNQKELIKISEWMTGYKPDMVNFINFNPHHGWKNDPLIKNIIANLEIIDYNINKAIEILEKNKIRVNVRYYPMCRISEKYWRCICNDFHVMFDPYEWDYKTMPKTKDRYFQWGFVTSNNNEEKGKPCNNCGIQNVCGGVNKYFHAASNDIYGEVLKPIQTNEKLNFYHYRQENNTLTVNY